MIVNRSILYSLTLALVHGFAALAQTNPDMQQFLAVVTEESGIHVQGALASRTWVMPLSRSISVRM